MFLIKTRVWRRHIYRLFVLLGLGSLALPGLLNVVGRQAPDGGGVLVVRPQLTELLLAVQPQPQMSVQHAVVAVVKPGDLPVTEEANVTAVTPGEAVHAGKGPYLTSWW